MYLVALATQNKPHEELKKLLDCKKKIRERVTLIANRLGNPGSTVAEWLILTPKHLMPKPEKVAFPKPPKAPDGSLLYERIPNKVEVTERISINQASFNKKRHYEEINGVDSK